MLNKIISAGALTIIAAICSPTFANDEPALSFESAEKCIAVYDSIIDIQHDLYDQDLQVSGEYSHFRVAQENYEKAIKKKNEIELKSSTLKPEDPEFELTAKQWEEANTLVLHWDEVRLVKLDSMQGVMYSRQLKVDRLRNLRRTALRCKGHTFNQTEITELCSTKTESKWCEGRF